MTKPEPINPLHDFIAAHSDAGPGTSIIRRAIAAMREHLGMDVGYVSEFLPGGTEFRAVDAPGHEGILEVGARNAIEDTYCGNIIQGRLPELIQDTAEEPVAMALPGTRAIPIGSNISVPIRLSDGTAYGMFCCFSFQPNRSLNERDLQMMRAFADLAAYEIERETSAARSAEDKRRRITDIVRTGDFSVVYQPVWSLDTGHPLGLESLTRFPDAAARPPLDWFDEAADIGMSVELEIATARKAFAAFDRLPAPATVGVNASPQSILAPAFQRMIGDWPTNRIILELTEHAHIEDYAAIVAALEPLREKGLRLAVDDAGAGYSCLQHILHLRPDLIKLDMSLTRHVDIDPARRALTTALIAFAKETGSRLVAEGVETASELNTLRALGIKQAQGFYLARPMPLEAALPLFDGASEQTPRRAAG